MADDNSTSVNSTNSTSDYRIIAEVLPLAVLIALVNSVVFYLFIKEKRLRKQPTNHLLLSLAVCDLMNGVLNIPIFLIRTFSSPEKISLGFFVVVLHNMVLVLVVYHILTITLDRYCAITRPFRHRQVTKKSTLKIILGTWMVGILIAFLPLTWWWEFLSSGGAILENTTLKIQAGYTVVCIILVFLFPYISITYLQVAIFRKINQGAYNLAIADGKADHRNSFIHGGNVHNMRRCLIIFAVMALVNLVCWFPWYTLSIINSLWFSISEEMRTALMQCSHAFLIIRYLTSIANPVLYILFKRDFKKALKTFLLGRRTQLDSRSSTRPISIIYRNKSVANITLPDNKGAESI